MSSESEHNEPQPETSKIHRVVQRSLLMGSLFLIPLYFFLILALMPYGYRAATELWHLCTNFLEMTEAELIISVLTLCDIVMIANLIDMVAVGSYQVFIKKIGVPDDQKPAWLLNISSGLLKIKMSTSLVGISSIHLLKDFIDATQTSWNIILKHMMLHVVFLISAAVLAVVEHLTHPAKH